MSQPPSVIVVSGLPGAGKSSTARALAQRFDRAAHVEADRLQELIVSGAELPNLQGVGPEARRQLDLRLRNACHLARSFVDAGFTAIIDDIVSGDRVEDVRHHLCGMPWLFVMLLPDFAHVKQRWVDMGSPFADAWDWIDTEIRTATPRTGLWLDTTDLGIEATVDAIVAELAELREAAAGLDAVLDHDG